MKISIKKNKHASLTPLQLRLVTEYNDMEQNYVGGYSTVESLAKRHRRTNKKRDDVDKVDDEDNQCDKKQR